MTTNNVSKIQSEKVTTTEERCITRTQVQVKKKNIFNNSDNEKSCSSNSAVNDATVTTNFGDPYAYETSSDEYIPSTEDESSDIASEGEAESPLQAIFDAEPNHEIIDTMNTTEGNGLENENTIVNSEAKVFFFYYLIVFVVLCFCVVKCLGTIMKRKNYCNYCCQWWFSLSADIKVIYGNKEAAMEQKRLLHILRYRSAQVF